MPNKWHITLGFFPIHSFSGIDRSPFISHFAELQNRSCPLLYTHLLIFPFELTYSGGSFPKEGLPNSVLCQLVTLKQTSWHASIFQGWHIYSPDIWAPWTQCHVVQIAEVTRSWCNSADLLGLHRRVFGLWNSVMFSSLFWKWTEERQSPEDCLISSMSFSPTASTLRDVRFKNKNLQHAM